MTTYFSEIGPIKVTKNCEVIGQKKTGQLCGFWVLRPKISRGVYNLEHRKLRELRANGVQNEHFKGRQVYKPRGQMRGLFK